MYFLMPGHGTPGDATRRGESRGHRLAGFDPQQGQNSRRGPAFSYSTMRSWNPIHGIVFWFSDEHRSPYQQIVHPLPRWHPAADFTMTHRYWFARQSPWIGRLPSMGAIIYLDAKSKGRESCLSRQTHLVRRGPD